MFRSLRRKRVAVTAVVLGVVAAAAFAYFTSSGTGTGSATVGTASPWDVDVAAATGGPLYPGAGSMTIPYTVTNPSSGHQQLVGTTATVASSGGNIVEDGDAVAGCSASWFTAVNNAPSGLPANLAGGGSKSGSVTVTMQDSDTNQDDCQGHSPDITVATTNAGGPPPPPPPSGNPIATFSGTGGDPLAYTVAPTGDSGTLAPGALTAIDRDGHSPIQVAPRCNVSYLTSGSQRYFGIQSSPEVSCLWTLTVNGTQVNDDAAAPGTGRATSTFPNGASVTLTVEVDEL